MRNSRHLRRRSGFHDLLFPGASILHLDGLALRPCEQDGECYQYRIIGQDFSAEVYQVSGLVTASNDAGLPRQDIVATGPGGTAHASTDGGGGYTFFLPNRTYTIQPPTYYTFNPPFITVTVNGDAVTNQNFVVQ